MRDLPVRGQEWFLRAVCDAQAEDHTQAACVPRVHGCHEDVCSGYAVAASVVRAVDMPKPGARHIAVKDFAVRDSSDMGVIPPLSPRTRCRTVQHGPHRGVGTRDAREVNG
ncbi:hypothetical protein GCM10027184_17200 [Saccharothrix stipae]